VARQRLLSGRFQQIGVVMRFGAFTRIEQHGLRYHLPAPIEEVLLPVRDFAERNTRRIPRLSRRGLDEVQSVPRESMMLSRRVTSSTSIHRVLARERRSQVSF
jgi:regulator of protease activity HflC (stomatin/prohibitin superfamily)